jgi:hypothetical protein
MTLDRGTKLGTCEIEASIGAGGMGEVCRARSMRLVVAMNLLGLPTAAVPVGVANGLPQGVQLIGPMYREPAVSVGVPGYDEKQHPALVQRPKMRKSGSSASVAGPVAEKR